MKRIKEIRERERERDDLKTFFLLLLSEEEKKEQ